MYWIVQHNDGRCFNVYHKNEARFWAWLSMEMIVCNVYASNGNGYTVSPCEIV